MTAGDGRPYAGALSLTEADVYLYETIATLEYTGHPVTRQEVAQVADMAGDRIDRRLGVLTRAGLLVRTEWEGETAYEPARRDWSAAPERPR